MVIGFRSGNAQICHYRKTFLFSLVLGKPFYFMLRVLFIVILFHCYHPSVVGQEYRKAFFHISADDGLGLSSNTITALLQDKKGFLWVGTANGLQRFDGYKFINYTTEKPGSEKLPDGQIRQLAPAENDCIWLLMDFSGTVGIFDPQKVTYRNVPMRLSGTIPPRAEYTLWTDSKGNAYINILRYGKILMFDREKFEFNEHTPLNQLPRGWKSASNVFEDTLQKRYWIVADSGMCVYDERTGETWSRNYNPKHLKILGHNKTYHIASEFFIDSKRRHWYFYWQGSQKFYCFNEQGEITNDTLGIQGLNTGYVELRKFLETRNKALWIYGPGCLYTLDSNGNKFQYYRNQYTDNYNIRYESVNHVIEDRDGLVWIATDQGLYYHSPRRNQVANIFLSETPGFYEVTDLLQTNTGDYWISTWGRGIVAWDQHFKPSTTGLYGKGMPEDDFSAIVYKQVWAMETHSSGKIHIGCQAGRLMIFDPETKKTEYLNPPEFDNRTIRYITEDKKGRLWFGTQSGRLICYDGVSFSVVYELEETAIIYKLLIDKRNGWIWLATHERGLFAIHPETGKEVAHYNSKKTNGGLFGNWVSDLEQLNDSTLFATASGALHIINIKTKEVKVLTKEQGLPSNTAERIRLDVKGYLWIVTQNGLCHYDYRKQKFSSFSKNDGVFLGNLVSKCDIVDRNNNILFAGPNSLLIFNPDAFYNNPSPPPVVITDFKLLDQFLPVDSLEALKTIRLQPGENSFSIYFSSLSYRNRGQLTYFYKLEGADKEWIKAEGSPSAQYRLLPPGKYTFQIRVENLDGVAAQKITTLNILVKPHFWQTGWFISSLLLAFALIFYGMHRLRLNKLMAVEKIRARVSRDLHDDMGSTLSTINILSSMAKAKLSTDIAKTADFIGKIGDNSQRMMEAMDDIVWAIKPDNDTMQKLIARMREFATNVLEAKDILMDFMADEKLNDFKPDMEIRRDLFLLFKEAVNNAAKYSKGSRVSISLEAHGQKIKLIVQDNGQGFDVNNADSGNGLGNMQRRAGALRGQLKIASGPDIGTTITLIAPLNSI
jgi:signal transduction histidine kinase/ligand-binding sensor domain-containing protein